MSDKCKPISEYLEELYAEDQDMKSLVDDASYEISHHQLEILVELTKETSYIMPSGMTREQRRDWAKQQEKTND